jgi:hypothetical protein
MMRSNLELHIERIVLDGLADVDRDQLSVAFKQEMERLFLEKGIPPGLRNGGSLAQLNGDALNVGHAAKANSIGTQLARSVYGGFKR